MANDALIIDALKRRFRQKLADETLTLAALKTTADAALTALQGNTTVISVSFEGGGTSAIENCNPANVLAACSDLIDEQAETNTDHGTGATHIDMSRNPVGT